MSGFAQHAALLAATIATGLLAGVFYGFACGVMIALKRVDDGVFVDVMQKINAAIQNGWFMLSFLGSLVFMLVAGAFELGDGGSALLPLVIALVFDIGTFVVTFGINIPLNNQLDRAGRHGRVADPATARRLFEGPWNRWNAIRALLATVSFGFLCWALELNAAGA
jgi:uncharacterized membrane protein